MDEKNKLYFGDNLNVLREYVADASVDLIYLDPPFNSSASYNVLFKENVAQGPQSGPAAFQLFGVPQMTAFEDKGQWSLEAEAVCRKIVTNQAGAERFRSACRGRKERTHVNDGAVENSP
jgi:site-specific DNA-methyltransferase (adenine-specific)